MKKERDRMSDNINSPNTNETDPVSSKIPPRTVLLIALILIALISFFGLSKIASSPSFFSATINSLDEKRNTVMKLTATAAATATALAVIPSNATTPISNQIAQLTSYFVIILCAIILEKLLLSVVGLVTFKFIIPLACLLGVLYLYLRKEVLRSLAIKLAVFGIILFLVIPVSVKTSDLIDSFHQYSIEEKIAAAEQNTIAIEEQINALPEEERGLLASASSYISNLASNIGGGISDVAKKAESTLGTFIEAIAVLIITTCVIPILVILIFIWLVKILFRQVKV
jgi:hypothetical protein